MKVALDQHINGLKLSKDAKNKALELLGKIGKLNDGILLEDCNIGEEEKNNYFNLKIEQALTNYFICHANSISPFQFDLDSSYLDEETYIPRKNLNSVAPKDLVEIGISERSSDKIINLRKEVFVYTDFDQLEDILSKEEEKIIKRRTYIYRNTNLKGIASEKLNEYCKSPSLSNYLGLLNAGYRKNSEQLAEPVDELIINELELIFTKQLSTIKSIRTYPIGSLENDYKLQVEWKKKRESLIPINKTPAKGQILYNYIYAKFLIDKIESAEKSINMLMFYFSYDGRRKSPITDVYTALKNAVERGVKVNVVLDKDGEQDYYLSRKINKNAIKALKRAGVNAITDNVDDVTHSKVVTIDDKWSIVGSHNITLSALFKYEEVSIAIEDDQLAKYYRNRIETFFLEG